MEKVLVLKVGEYVEGVFRNDKELVKEFFTKSYQTNDINVDELFNTGKTKYDFGQFQGIETITLTEHIIM